MFAVFKIAEKDWVRVLNGFVYYVSLPAVIITSFWQINLLDPAVGKLVAQNSLVLIIFSAAILLLLAFLKISPRLKAEFFMVTVVGNTIYMGIPIAGQAFGAGGASLVVAAASVQIVLGIVFGILGVEFFVVKSKKLSNYISDFVNNPLMISLGIGIILSLLGLRGPLVTPAQKSLAMLGATASPAALFALGGFMRGKFEHRHLKLAFLASLVKLLAFPIVIYFLVRFFAGTASPAASVSALMASMPAAVTTFVIAEKYNLDKSFVANAILISTVLSLFSISFFLAVFV